MNTVALLMLIGDRSKYLGLIFAIAFSSFLLENQTSIFAGILARTGSQVRDVTDATVWVMDPATQYFEETKKLPDTALLRVRSVPGVAYAVSLFKGNPIVRTESGMFTQAILVGADDSTLIGAPRKMMLGSWERLAEPDAAIIDKAGYMRLYPGEPFRLGRVLEVNDHKLTLVGISNAGAPFTSFPIMHTRYSIAVNCVGQERNQLSFVVAQPNPGISQKTLSQSIAQETGLRARTRNEFIWDCINFYLSHTGIPVNFGITIGIAILIGLVVSGQTFYLFTVENLNQFGALKAIGVTNRRLVGMILLQAATVGFVGFGLGTGMAAVFFETFSRMVATREIVLLWQNVVGVGVLMALVVTGASLLSIRRVLILEPAEVFR